MILICVSPYRGTINHFTGEEGAFRAGEEIHTTDEIAAFLLRSSPGSFVREGEAIPEDVIADAPDRRARGGRRR